MNLVDVDVQQLGRSKPPSTVGADVVVLLRPATFSRHVLVRLLLGQRLDPLHRKPPESISRNQVLQRGLARRCVTRGKLMSSHGCA